MSETVSKGPKPKRETHNCCVPQCSAVKSSENHMHYVPRDAALRKKWAIAIKTGKGLSDRMRVCSRHFKEEDYKISLGTGKTRRLKPDAVPSQNLPVRTHEKILTSPAKRKMKARAGRARKRTIWSDENDAPCTSNNKASSGSDGEKRIVMKSLKE